jgi:hypothetical protein
LQAVLQEEYWAHNEPRGPQYMNVNWLGPAIIHFGTEEQKRFFLPKLAAGKMQWAQGFSEPEAGSDLAALRCSAVPDGDDFVVNGQKIWISYGDIADYCFLLCRTDPASSRKEGLSVLLVDLSLPGVERRPISSTLGYHRINELFFDDVYVSRSALLGPQNDGWRVATTALAFERSGSARYARAARTMGLIERRHGHAWDDTRWEQFASLLAFGRATRSDRGHRLGNVGGIVTRGVCLVGMDNSAIEPLPPRPGTNPLYVHETLLRDHGIYMLELLDLAELAASGAGGVSVHDRPASPGSRAGQPGQSARGHLREREPRGNPAQRPPMYSANTSCCFSSAAVPDTVISPRLST